MASLFQRDMSLKGNLSALGKAYFPLRAETIDKGHGGLAHRRLLASTALNDYIDFPDLT